jgi:hypothetical protein
MTNQPALDGPTGGHARRIRAPSHAHHPAPLTPLGARARRGLRGDHLNRDTQGRSGQCVCALLLYDLTDDRKQVRGKNADRRIDHIDIGVAKFLPDQVYLGFEGQECVTAIPRNMEDIVAGPFAELACTQCGSAMWTFATWRTWRWRR